MSSQILQAKARLRPQLGEWAYDNCAHAWPKLKQRLLLPQPRSEFVIRLNKLCSDQDFAKLFEFPSLPCVLPQACMQGWTLLSQRMANFDFLRANFAREKIECGKDAVTGLPVHVKLGEFLSYQATQQDRSPMYIFDSKMPLFRSEYTTSKVFGEDYLDVIFSKRPPFRWELLGPERSGSSLHVDPLFTSAWNTLLLGRKLWVLLSPNTQVDGFGPEVRAIDFFEHHLTKTITKLRPENRLYYFVQEPGETVFVPSGWHHAVLNLEDTIALTQNWVGNANLNAVWRSIRMERKKLAWEWKIALKRSNPLVFHRIEALDLEDGFDLQVEITTEREQRQLDKQRKLK
ncbi:hypothetical protein BASA81_006505 [Batrachochytrium salamandrivorans]|nr:hypothetical protein BASA81_006505 [Batrachochytrium salamandrivorans]